jgi:hypothetical protein
MSFEMIDLYRLYQCESGDVKKTDNIETGSILYETDTGFEYKFNGVSWVFFPKTMQISDGSNTVGVIPVNGENGLVVAIPNHISTLNSTTELLGIDEMFPGVLEEMTNYAIMFVNVYSDVASATDGLCIDASPDGVNWYESECYTIAADTYKTFSLQCAAKYFKIRYKNGGVAQTTFHIEVKLCTKNALDSSHRISDIISDQDDATLNKSVLTAQRTDNNLFVPITASNSSNLRVTDAEGGLAISKGEVNGTDYTHKFGDALDFDASDGEVHVWDAAEDGQPWEQMIYTFPIGENVDSLSSTDNTDTELITLEGLDINGVEVIQDVALQGHTRVSITPLYRFHRGYCTNGTKFAGHVIISEDDGNALVDGVPVDTTLIKGVIQPENQQTEMAIYTIPTGFTGYMWSWYANTAGAKKDTTYIIKLNTRLKDKVFRLKHRGSISDGGSSYIQHNYKVPKKFPAGTDIEMTVQMTLATAIEGSVSAGFEIVLVAD